MARGSDYSFPLYNWASFLIVIVVLNLNGSSIGSWDKIVSERSDDKKTDVIFGGNREVRSDEWMVQTPFIFHRLKVITQL